MRVRDLGALTVTVDGVERPVAGSRAATILAMLVIHVNRRVSVEALLDATWGEGATGASVSTLESHVWRLRQLLEPHRAQRQPPTVLLNENNGYRLVADGHAVDSVAFAHLSRDVDDLLSAGRADAAIARADDALRLWRGRPYGTLGDESWAQPAVARLNELFRHTCESRIDALIAVGRIEQALADLEPLIADAPFRERLRGQQMLAFYRAGRSDEALSAFRRARSALIDEIGSEPGTELRTLHAQILTQDVALDGAARPAPISTTPRDVHLPPSLTPLLGRAGAVVALTELIQSRPLVTLTGAAGIGKTRLAVEVGRTCANQFPDGVWFVELSTLDDPDFVVDTVISTIGVAPSPASTPSEDLADYCRGRRMLLILDNCEHVVEAVSRLVSAILGHGHPQCVVLATSRTPLDLDAEVTWTVAPLALPVTGESAADAPAVQLLLDRLARVDPSLVIDDDVRAAAVEICVAVDGLPLAIELAAGRVRSHSLGDVLAQTRTDLGALGRPGHRDTLRATIDSSHLLLDPISQLAHRRLAVLPGRFSLSAAAAVVGDLQPDDVDDVLARLVHRSMLASATARKASGRSGFRQLATVRAHAAHLLLTDDDPVAAADRRNRWTADLIASRPRLGMAGEHQWFTTLDDDDATIRATLSDVLIDRPDPNAARLCAPLGFYWYFRTRVIEATRWLRLARAAAADTDPSGWVCVTLVLASAMAVHGQIDAARPLVREAVDKIPMLPEAAVVDVGEALVVLGSGLWVHPDPEIIVAVDAALRQVAVRSDDVQLSLLADVLGCTATAVRGALDEAADRAEQLYEVALAADNTLAAWMSAATPMTAAVIQGDPERGIPWVRRVMHAHLAAGGTTAGMFIENRANYETQRGDHRQAASLYAAAYTHTRRAAMVWPRRPVTDELLARTRAALSHSEFEAAWRDGETWDLAQIAALD
ncbi:MAG: BTAD domain-containing putative transcriptional regulator [Mycobacterium kyogaense]|uniref:AfsR/SARP family transcriptional regulator n=1 Tax=Mycobacterium kyogaense TaxID=2212479 RepID=UPI002FFA1F66